jgi:hypothetical protein
MKLVLALGLAALSAGAAVAQTPPANPPPNPQAPPAPPCAAAPYHQFDFWVGRWDVYPNGKQKLVAHSLIESLYGGCAIRENWMPLAGGGSGGSLSSFVADDNGWRQTWVDASGARVDFKGGYVGEAMVLTGFWPNVLGLGKGALVRMTYTRQPGGAVRQLGEASTDDGKTWQPNFDFIYRPSNLKTPIQAP